MSTTVQIAGQTHECSFAVKAEIERLRAALEPFAEMLNGNEREGGWEPNDYDKAPDDFVVRSIGTMGRDYACITVGHLRAARASLKNS